MKIRNYPLIAIFVLLAWNFCPSAFAERQGNIVAWGVNDHGQLNNIPAGNNFIAISGGGRHSLALRKDGSIVGWGYNYRGQASPPAGNNFIAISAGQQHSLALRKDGTIAGWGYNVFGQATPPPGNNYIAISAGNDYSLALRSDGSIVGWGWNTPYGQATPPPGHDFIAIAAAKGYGSHSHAMRSDGSIVSWGNNDYGLATPPAGQYIAIASGDAHNFALRSDGSIVGWGWDAWEMLPPPAGNNYIAIGAGSNHGLALRSDGSLVGWGYSNYGPPTGNNFFAIATGDRHCLALQSDIGLNRFEINQGFQEVVVDGTMQRNALIETKPFVVRVTLEKYSPGRITIQAKLSVYNAATSRQMGPTKRQTTTIDPRSIETLDFLFNDNETRNIKAGNYRFSLVVEDGIGAKRLESNLTYEFKTVRTIRMLVVPVLRYNAQIGSWNDGYLRFVEQVFPLPKTTASGVNRLEIIRGSVLQISGPNASYSGVMVRLNNLLQSYNANHPSSKVDVISAVVPGGVLPADAMGARRGSAIVIQSQDNSQYLLGHEMGHILGLGEEYVDSDRKNANGLWILDETFQFNRNPPPLKFDASGPFIIDSGRLNAGQRCNWEDDPTLYSSPTSVQDADGNIIRWWSSGRFIGEGGYDLQNNREVSVSTLSMMSGNDDDKWVSGAEYKSLGDNLLQLIPPSSRIPEPPGSGPTRVMIQGIMDIPGHSVEFGPLETMTNVAQTEESFGSHCQFLLMDSLGYVKETYQFAPLESDMPGSRDRGPFLVITDLPQGMVKIRAIINNVVAGELNLSDHAPAVTVTAPNDGTITDPLVVRWAGTDQDGDPLSYRVEYSNDNGASWSVLALDLKESEMTVDQGTLAGGNACLIKVKASDGWNQSEDVTDTPFVIANKPPQITILEPKEGTILYYNEPMQARCVAHDPETGELADPSGIEWTSDLQGFLGNGNLLGFALSPGLHVLSVKARDSEGQSATSSVHVTVVENITDFNSDYSVDLKDLVTFSENWLQSCSSPDWCAKTDMDQNGQVDLNDFLILAQHWMIDLR
jgi:alpha-tubulin suppressor-like RCC1 family protein